MKKASIVAGRSLGRRGFPGLGVRRRRGKELAEVADVLQLALAAAGRAGVKGTLDALGARRARRGVLPAQLVLRRNLAHRDALGDALLRRVNRTREMILLLLLAGSLCTPIGRKKRVHAGVPECAGARRPAAPASARPASRNAHSIAAAPPSPSWAGPHSPTGTAAPNAAPKPRKGDCLKNRQYWWKFPHTDRRGQVAAIAAPLYCINGAASYLACVDVQVRPRAPTTASTSACPLSPTNPTRRT